MKFYLDENLSTEIAKMLRAQGVDVISAHEVGNERLSDRAQLRYAAREGRAIVTRDVTDFPRLALEAIAANTEHAGIILVSPRVPSREFSTIADGIRLIGERYPGGLSGVVLHLLQPPSGEARRRG